MLSLFTSIMQLLKSNADKQLKFASRSKITFLQLHVYCAETYFRSLFFFKYIFTCVLVVFAGNGVVIFITFFGDLFVVV